MHFVFLTLGYHPDLAGGAYRYVAEVAQRLAARGHEVDVICPNPENRLAAEETRAEVRLHRYRDEAGFFYRNWRREIRSARDLLTKIIDSARGPILVINCHAFFEPVPAGLAVFDAYLFTGPWAEEFKLSRQARARSAACRWRDNLIAARLRQTENRALRAARKILTISRYYVEQLPRWHGAGLPPVQMISGGVDLDRFQPPSDRAAVRARFGVKPETFLLLTVRRLDPRMGLDRLIDAFARVAKEFPVAQLWLAGTGPQADELRARVAAHELGNRARLLGYMPEEDLPGLYAAADCTLMPSLDLEGFGLATAESLACGTPVLGSRAGATPELLEPLDSKLLFDATSVEAVAAKLRATLANPGVLPAREKCRSYAVEKFSWDGPVGACEEAFRVLTAQIPGS